MEVVGRDSELEAIAQWLRETPADVLVVEGEPGMGKTTLWRAARLLEHAGLVRPARTGEGGPFTAESHGLVVQIAPSNRTC